MWERKSGGGQEEGDDDDNDTEKASSVCGVSGATECDLYFPYESAVPAMDIELFESTLWVDA